MTGIGDKVKGLKTTLVVVGCSISITESLGSNNTVK
jgi:hypothetical protein